MNDPPPTTPLCTDVASLSDGRRRYGAFVVRMAARRLDNWDLHRALREMRHARGAGRADIKAATSRAQLLRLVGELADPDAPPVVLRMAARPGEDLLARARRHMSADRAAGSVTRRGVASRLRPSPGGSVASDVGGGGTTEVAGGEPVTSDAGGGTALNKSVASDVGSSVASDANRTTLLVTDPGTALSADDGTALVTDPGTALSTDDGTALVTDPGTALSADPGTALYADGGTALVTDPGTALSTDDGTALVTDPGTALSADPGTALYADGGIAQVTYSSTAPLAADGGTDQVADSGLCGVSGCALFGRDCTTLTAAEHVPASADDDARRTDAEEQVVYGMLDDAGGIRWSWWPTGDGERRGVPAAGGEAAPAEAERVRCAVLDLWRRFAVPRVAAASGRVASLDPQDPAYRAYEEEAVRAAPASLAEALRDATVAAYGDRPPTRAFATSLSRALRSLPGRAPLALLDPVPRRWFGARSDLYESYREERLMQRALMGLV